MHTIKVGVSQLAYGCVIVNRVACRGSDLAMGIPVDQPPTSPVSRAMPPLLAESFAGNIDSVRPSHYL